MRVSSLSRLEGECVSAGKGAATGEDMPLAATVLVGEDTPFLCEVGTLFVCELGIWERAVESVGERAVWEGERAAELVGIESLATVLEPTATSECVESLVTVLEATATSEFLRRLFLRTLFLLRVVFFLRRGRRMLLFIIRSMSSLPKGLVSIVCRWSSIVSVWLW